MGKLCVAAKITHVPTMIMSEQPGKLHGCRKAAIDGHKQIAQLAKDLDVDTIVVLDTHWLVNAGYHINANQQFTGNYTSHEFPHFIQNLEYQYYGNAELGNRIADKATDKGVFTLSHQVESLDLEYGTLVPMRYMNEDSHFKVVSVAAWCSVHSIESSRILGEAIREAIEESDSRVMLLASGSLSHRIWDNDDYAANNGTFTISKEFNRQVDLRVLDLWQSRDYKTFLDMLPDYAALCSGEGGMHDTAMLFGALGWDKYEGKAEIVTEYFPSSGTGQVNVLFEVTE
ncbi:3,4-dihydroxyphenylacetate 2,3-dioxygenase [Photobacterium sp. BZF1]|uniref:3,4-dihydroxyphenylacetate 2,3-dioxygenase n=1 Tax=Photobacterium rosenbergii TaxID=294936 RepID=A0A2T3NB06_9GAMM|nr:MULTISPECIES: 3,4-dihydroxyphenylacetate 2,3-dioxygenase [Photobacterium]MBC7006129.1 3,4-dihydroxyphenylacetate 2,3-dioxygenase [Photobacterium sp. BZF1]PSW10872.1 3,4-dihydroxyphenylacetate 2,3-dioxygenase [Photobacterium rosenbergii]WEM44935.1 3,4-dihydroxyphenylacetate 2,3-dioxygenase [Photobacterium sp. DA100]